MDIILKNFNKNTFAYICVKSILIALSTILSTFLIYQLLDGSLAKQPFYTDVVGLMPLSHIGALMRSSSSVLASFSLIILFTLALSLVLTQILIATIFLGKSENETIRKVYFKQAPKYLWSYLKIMIYALILIAVGGWLIMKVFSHLSDMSHRQEWSLWWIAYAIFGARFCLLLIWSALVGVWALNCKAAITRHIKEARPKKAVFKFLLVPFGFWRRRLVSTLLLPFLVPLSIQLFTAFYLYYWRQNPPDATAGIVTFNLAWAVLLILSAGCWVWVLQLLANTLKSEN